MKRNFFVITLLCIISLCSIGFSSWCISQENKFKTMNLEIEGDKVDVLESIKEFGIKEETLLIRNISYYTHKTDVSNLTTEFDNLNVLIALFVDIQDNTKLSLLNYDNQNYAYVEIYFDIVGYNGTNYQLEDYVIVKPHNYDNFSFKIDQSKKNTFYLPLKSTKKLSLYALSRLDEAYPLKTADGMDYYVPIDFIFTFKKETLKSFNLLSQLKFNVCFNLVSEI